MNKWRNILSWDLLHYDQPDMSKGHWLDTVDANLEKLDATEIPWPHRELLAKALEELFYRYYDEEMVGAFCEVDIIYADIDYGDPVNYLYELRVIYGKQGVGDGDDRNRTFSQMDSDGYVEADDGNNFQVSL